MTERDPISPSDEGDDDEYPPERDALYRTVVATAANLYGTQGYRDTPLDQILEAAGVGPADFQARFTDSEDLFCAVHAHVYEEMRQAVSGVLQNLSGGPDAVARRGLSAFFHHLKMHPATARVLFIDALRVGPRAEAVSLDRVAEFGMMFDLLISSLYEAELPEQDYRQKWVVNSLMGAVAGVTYLWIREDYQTPENTLAQTTYGLFRAVIRQWLDVLRLDKKIIAANLPSDSNAYVSLGYVMPLLDYLREQGRPVEPVLDLLGLDEGDLASQTRMIGLAREKAAFELAAAMTADPDIGLHVGERVRLSCLGILGHLLLTCASLEEALVIQKRFGRLTRNIGHLSYAHDVEGYYLALYQPDGSPQRERQQIERLLAGTVALARELAGHHLSPKRLEFPFPRPEDTREHQRFFRCPIEYNARELRCYFAPDDIRRPLPGGSPELRQALEAEATRQLHALSGVSTDANPRIAALKGYILENLRDGVPELAVAAQHLGTSTRSLQRLLEARKTHYSEIIDEVRRERAVAYLKESELGLVDIAIELGFGDQSSFNRAFKRWFNSTPSEYRKLQF